jgi:hypothetical protein
MDRIYQIYMKYCTLILALIPLLGLTALGTNQALAWDGQGWNGGYWGHGLGCGDGCDLDFHHWFHHWNFGNCCDDNQGSCCAQGVNNCCDQGPVDSCCGQSQSEVGCNAFCAGEADAVYDHNQDIQYNPVGSCLPCHSQDYWNNFHQGYDHKWNAFQAQGSDQNTKVSIIGNNNYVSTNQVNNQQQNPLQHLAQDFCGLVNCQDQQSQGLDN